ncbi:MAG: hypothetical protein U1F77_20055 [Kiritimatiellia bacterium]
MKTHLLSLALLACAATASAQGPLTPPGGPGQTMKSLDQIEPRTVIPGGGAYVISSPGSYVLSGPIQVAAGNGISVNASRVSIDLNGFSIVSTHATGDGVGVSVAAGQKNIQVFNGHIRGSSSYNEATLVFTSGGFIYGVSAGDIPGVILHDLCVEGISGRGLFANLGAVRDCQVRECGEMGIFAATVSRCSSLNINGAAISAKIVSDCQAVSVCTASWGGAISGAESVFNSSGKADAGVGVAGITVQNCRGESMASDGISGEVVANSSGRSSSLAGSGIRAEVVSYSRGMNQTGWPAITATRSAIGCSVLTGTVTSPNKLLGTP